ncbi:hypothetical protein [Hoyosella subflava]|uniref:hypothetical protein n=1 Tax=Hoyosella subflava TaxID=639313 RepID=UPI00031404AB|nr:hypothetical protein [Hoyosella subflava]
MWSEALGQVVRRLCAQRGDLFGAALADIDSTVCEANSRICGSPNALAQSGA